MGRANLSSVSSFTPPVGGTVTERCFGNDNQTRGQPRPAVGVRADFPALSCGARSRCVLGGAAGHLASSTHPARGTTSWSLTNADPGRSVTAVSCVAAALCAAGDNDGNTLIGTT